MRPISFTLTAAESQEVQQLVSFDVNRPYFAVSIQINPSFGTSGSTYSVQYTNEKIQTTNQQFATTVVSEISLLNMFNTITYNSNDSSPTLVNVSVPALYYIPVPISAVIFTVNGESSTGGSATFTIIQQGI